MIVLMLFVNEYIEFKNLLGVNFELTLFVISGIITVFVSLIFIFLGTKFKIIQNLFCRHEYEKEPSNLSEHLDLFFKAPRYSGNGICMWRIWASLPLILIVIFFYNNTYFMIFIGNIYLLLFASDGLDGVIARKLNNVTKIGEVLDPLADKILDLPILLILCVFSSNSFFIFIAIFIVIFDVIGQLIRGKSKNPAASIIGKTKTVLKMIAIAFLWLDVFGFNPNYNIGLLLIITLILTFWSFWGKLSPQMKSNGLKFTKRYLYLNYSFIRNILRKKAKN